MIIVFATLSHTNALKWTTYVQIKQEREIQFSHQSVPLYRSLLNTYFLLEYINLYFSFSLFFFSLSLYLC